MNLSLAKPLAMFLIFAALVVSTSGLTYADDDRDAALTQTELELVRRLEQRRLKAIQKVIGSVVAIYDDDRGGGGSGVIIDPSGIALTNHHVIMGAGIHGWGGVADGNLYRWKLIGTDPGGDVAIIQLESDKPFPYSDLADSDTVRVGDWALAMGNPFILTEDQKPTITLGIVSGVKRYQPGAGMNQLVYGNCIQVDSSINPGNSGGPLFSLDGEVIGINGRGSFQDRGRVNVGLGYAISSNQIKNFIPDLLATKLVEHATIDANFGDRGDKVLCETINQDSVAAKNGLDLGDELLEFEGIPIRNAHQYTNLICTLPEDWPVSMKIRTTAGETKTIVFRALGLPYAKPRAPAAPNDDQEKTPEQQKKIQRQQDMIRLLSATPGTIRQTKTNLKYATQLIDQWRNNDRAKLANESDAPSVIRVEDKISSDGKTVGGQTSWLCTDGRFRIEIERDGEKQTVVFDGERFSQKASNDDPFKEMTLTQAKLNLPVVQAAAMLAPNQERPFGQFGRLIIDGGDRAFNQNAYRMKMLDEDDDWFYFWLRMYDENGRPSPRILKASADKDCDQNDGGVIFEDWKAVDGWMIPHQRHTVTGLGELRQAGISVEKAESVPLDETMFKADSKTEN